MVEAVIEQTTTTQPLTLEGWMAAYSNEHPIEVINGEMVIMTPPDVQHVFTAHNLFRSLDRYIDQHQLGRAWLETPYLLEASDRTDWVRGSRVPDVSFVTQARIDAHIAQYGTRGPFRLAPDLAVEIISPGDNYEDIDQKVIDYLRYGVRLVWVINPRTRTVRTYTPDAPGGKIFYEHDTLTGAPVLPEWSTPVAALFSIPDK